MGGAGIIGSNDVVLLAIHHSATVLTACQRMNQWSLLAQASPSEGDGTACPPPETLGAVLPKTPAISGAPFEGCGVCSNELELEPAKMH